MMARLNACSLL